MIRCMRMLQSFADSLASVRSPAHQTLKIAKRVTAHNAGDMDKVARIDEC